MEEFKGCAATVRFLRTVDSAFDALNSRNPLGKGFNAPNKPTTKDRKQAETMLCGMKVEQYNKMVPFHTTKKKTDHRKKAIYDFIANGRSALNIYHDLVERAIAPCRYLLTCKLKAAISYITGFVVKKMKEKITCLPCSQALTTDGAAHDFIHLKDRGGLQKPSPGMLSVCLTTEKYIQKRITSGGQLPCGRGITLAISSEVIADCAE
ncbi:DNA transposase THAP9 [Anabarilius grahami]|uniref:DNA transposase THAP9 n=1 Tax=Anabarilius grahami TaxID=495550 RepID=A0A3N0Z4P8_ANAGA|nr:DNA transposase THAP9 [Anabarilius grahami]